MGKCCYSKKIFVVWVWKFPNFLMFEINFKVLIEMVKISKCKFSMFEISSKDTLEVIKIEISALSQNQVKKSINFQIFEVPIFLLKFIHDNQSIFIN